MLLLKSFTPLIKRGVLEELILLTSLLFRTRDQTVKMVDVGEQLIHTKRSTLTIAMKGS